METDESMVVTNRSTLFKPSFFSSLALLATTTPKVFTAIETAEFSPCKALRGFSRCASQAMSHKYLT